MLRSNSSSKWKQVLGFDDCLPPVKTPPPPSPSRHSTQPRKAQKSHSVHFPLSPPPPKPPHRQLLSRRISPYLHAGDLRLRNWSQQAGSSPQKSTVSIIPSLAHLHER